jgi:hypothetical protein
VHSTATKPLIFLHSRQAAVRKPNKIRGSRRRFEKFASPPGQQIRAGVFKRSTRKPENKGLYALPQTPKRG